ncbi:MAG: nucleotidyltransferase domain-containing protein [Candidatus Pacearchaeota archaeon]|nr:nucleotidyltransferase domain-containing protein [Candidatus Pacearchaeota archaeon]
MEEIILLKLTSFFLENSYEEFYLRELSKKLKISVFAVKKYADYLLKEGLIQEERKGNLRYFKANLENLFFKHLKISRNINLITKSGLVEFLKENLSNVSSIVLFGSVARGENNKESDIDINIIGKEKTLDLEKFEDKLNKKINLHVLSWSEWNAKVKKDSAFYFDVITQGISLYGELPIIK